MAFLTTSISVSTVATALISTGTTWANTLGARQGDETPFGMFNPSAQSVYVGGSAMTSGAPGLPILTNQTFQAQLMGSDPVFAVTTAGTVTVTVIAGRQ